MQNTRRGARPESTLPPLSSLRVMGAASGIRSVSVCPRLDVQGPGGLQIASAYARDVSLSFGEGPADDRRVRHPRPRSPVLVIDTLRGRRKHRVRRTKRTWRWLMSDVDPSRDGRRARGRLLPLPPEAPGGLRTTCRTRGSPLNTRSSRPATCDSCSGCVGEAASGTQHSSLPPTPPGSRAGLFSGGTSASSAPGRWALCSGACSPARSEPAGVWRRPPSAAAMEPLRLLQAARYTVLAYDDHANEAPRVPSRKATAPRRIPVAVPES